MPEWPEYWVYFLNLQQKKLAQDTPVTKKVQGKMDE